MTQDAANFRRSIQNPKSKIQNVLGGQVTLEYFILFATTALLTLIGLTMFDDNMKNSLGRFVDAAARKMTAP